MIETRDIGSQSNDGGDVKSRERIGPGDMMVAASYLMAGYEWTAAERQTMVARPFKAGKRTVFLIPAVAERRLVASLCDANLLGSSITARALKRPPTFTSSLRDGEKRNIKARAAG